MRTLPVRPRIGPPSGRLDFLDGLRGVAVGLVLLQHIGELCFPAVREFTTGTLQLGQLGVTVFFLCSGFIIPASLERSGREPGRRPALRAFWISRAFRLYPMYWLSLAAAAGLVTVGRYAPEESLSAGHWLANAALLQLPAGAPHALDLYWTLAFEMVFYTLVSGLFLLGWHRRSVLVSLAASGVCLTAAVAAQPLLGRPAPLGLFCLATMFLGTVVHRWHGGQVRLRTLACCGVTTGVAGAALLASSGGAGTPGVIPMLTAWLAAYVIFGMGLALRHRATPSWLRRLGTISYSVYLVQALVLIAVPALPSSALTAVLWTGLVIGLSELTFRTVEQPAVRLGRQIASRRDALAQPPLREQPLPTPTGRIPGRRVAERRAVRTATTPRRMAV